MTQGLAQGSTQGLSTGGRGGLSRAVWRGLAASLLLLLAPAALQAQTFTLGPVTYSSSMAEVVVTTQLPAPSGQTTLTVFEGLGTADGLGAVSVRRSIGPVLGGNVHGGRRSELFQTNVPQPAAPDDMGRVSLRVPASVPGAYGTLIVLLTISQTGVDPLPAPVVVPVRMSVQAAAAADAPFAYTLGDTRSGITATLTDNNAAVGRASDAGTTVTVLRGAENQNTTVSLGALQLLGGAANLFDGNVSLRTSAPDGDGRVDHLLALPASMPGRYGTARFPLALSRDASTAMLVLEVSAAAVPPSDQREQYTLVGREFAFDNEAAALDATLALRVRRLDGVDISNAVLQNPRLEGGNVDGMPITALFDGEPELVIDAVPSRFGGIERINSVALRAGAPHSAAHGAWLAAMRLFGEAGNEIMVPLRIDVSSDDMTPVDPVDPVDPPVDVTVPFVDARATITVTAPDTAPDETLTVAVVTGAAPTVTSVSIGTGRLEGGNIDGLPPAALFAGGMLPSVVEGTADPDGVRDFSLAFPPVNENCNSTDHVCYGTLHTPVTAFVGTASVTTEFVLEVELQSPAAACTGDNDTEAYAEDGKSSDGFACTFPLTDDDLEALLTAPQQAALVGVADRFAALSNFIVFDATESMGDELIGNLMLRHLDAGMNGEVALVYDLLPDRFGEQTIDLIVRSLDNPDMTARLGPLTVRVDAVRDVPRVVLQTDVPFVAATQTSMLLAENANEVTFGAGLQPRDPDTTVAGQLSINLPFGRVVSVTVSMASIFSDFVNDAAGQSLLIDHHRSDQEVLRLSEVPFEETRGTATVFSTSPQPYDFFRVRDGARVAIAAYDSAAAPAQEPGRLEDLDDALQGEDAISRRALTRDLLDSFVMVFRATTPAGTLPPDPQYFRLRVSPEGDAARPQMELTLTVAVGPATVGPVSLTHLLSDVTVATQFPDASDEVTVTVLRATTTTDSMGAVDVSRSLGPTEGGNVDGGVRADLFQRGLPLNAGEPDGSGRVDWLLTVRPSVPGAYGVLNVSVTIGQSGVGSPPAPVVVPLRLSVQASAPADAPFDFTLADTQFVTTVTLPGNDATGGDGSASTATVTVLSRAARQDAALGPRFGGAPRLFADGTALRFGPPAADGRADYLWEVPKSLPGRYGRALFPLTLADDDNPLTLTLTAAVAAVPPPGQQEQYTLRGREFTLGNAARFAAPDLLLVTDMRRLDGGPFQSANLRNVRLEGGNVDGGAATDLFTSAPDLVRTGSATRQDLSLQAATALFTAHGAWLADLHMFGEAGNEFVIPLRIDVLPFDTMGLFAETVATVTVTEPDNAPDTAFTVVAVPGAAPTVTSVAINAVRLEGGNIDGLPLASLFAGGLLPSVVEGPADPDGVRDFSLIFPPVDENCDDTNFVCYGTLHASVTAFVEGLSLPSDFMLEVELQSSVTCAGDNDTEVYAEDSKSTDGFACTFPLTDEHLAALLTAEQLTALATSGDRLAALRNLIVFDDTETMGDELIDNFRLRHLDAGTNGEVALVYDLLPDQSGEQTVNLIVRSLDNPDMTARLGPLTVRVDAVRDVPRVVLQTDVPFVAATQTSTLLAENANEVTFGAGLQPRDPDTTVAGSVSINLPFGRIASVTVSMASIFGDFVDNAASNGQELLIDHHRSAQELLELSEVPFEETRGTATVFSRSPQPYDFFRVRDGARVAIAAYDSAAAPAQEPGRLEELDDALQGEDAISRRTLTRDLLDSFVMVLRATTNNNTLTLPGVEYFRLRVSPEGDAARPQMELTLTVAVGPATVGPVSLTHLRSEVVVATPPHRASDEFEVTVLRATTTTDSMGAVSVSRSFGLAEGGNVDGGVRRDLFPTGLPLNAGEPDGSGRVDWILTIPASRPGAYGTLNVSLTIGQSGVTPAPAPVVVPLRVSVQAAVRARDGAPFDVAFGDTGFVATVTLSDNDVTGGDGSASTATVTVLRDARGQDVALGQEFGIAPQLFAGGMTDLRVGPPDGDGRVDYLWEVPKSQPGRYGMALFPLTLEGANPITLTLTAAVAAVPPPGQQEQYTLRGREFTLGDAARFVAPGALPLATRVTLFGTGASFARPSLENVRLEGGNVDGGSVTDLLESAPTLTVTNAVGSERLDVLLNIPRAQSAAHGAWLATLAMFDNADISVRRIEVPLRIEVLPFDAAALLDVAAATITVTAPNTAPAGPTTVTVVAGAAAEVTRLEVGAGRLEGGNVEGLPPAALFAGGLLPNIAGPDGRRDFLLEFPPVSESCDGSGFVCYGTLYVPITVFSGERGIKANFELVVALEENPDANALRYQPGQLAQTVQLDAEALRGLEAGAIVQDITVATGLRRQGVGLPGLVPLVSLGALEFADGGGAAASVEELFAAAPFVAVSDGAGGADVVLRFANLLPGAFATMTYTVHLGDETLSGRVAIQRAERGLPSGATVRYAPGASNVTITVRPPGHVPAGGQTVRVLGGVAPTDGLSHLIGARTSHGGNLADVEGLFVAGRRLEVALNGGDYIVTVPDLLPDRYGRRDFELSFSLGAEEFYRTTLSVHIVAENDPPDFIVGNVFHQVESVPPATPSPVPGGDAAARTFARGITPGGPDEDDQAVQVSLDLGGARLAGGNVGGLPVASLFAVLPSAGLSAREAGGRTVYDALLEQNGEVRPGMHGALIAPMILSDDGVPRRTVAVEITLSVRALADRSAPLASTPGNTFAAITVVHPRAPEGRMLTVAIAAPAGSQGELLGQSLEDGRAIGELFAGTTFALASVASAPPDQDRLDWVLTTPAPRPQQDGAWLATFRLSAGGATEDIPLRVSVAARNATPTADFTTIGAAGETLTLAYDAGVDGVFEDTTLALVTPGAGEDHQALNANSSGSIVRGDDLFSALPVSRLREVGGSQYLVLEAGELRPNTSGAVAITVTLSDNGYPPRARTILYTVAVERPAPLSFEARDTSATITVRPPRAVSLDHTRAGLPLTLTAASMLGLTDGALSSVSAALVNERLEGGNVDGGVVTDLFGAPLVLNLQDGEGALGTIVALTVRTLSDGPRQNRYGVWHGTVSLWADAFTGAPALLPLRVIVEAVNRPVTANLQPAAVTVVTVGYDLGDTNVAAPPEDVTLATNAGSDEGFQSLALTSLSVRGEAFNPLGAPLASPDDLFTTLPMLRLEGGSNNGTVVLEAGELALNRYGSWTLFWELRDNGLPQPEEPVAGAFTLFAVPNNTQVAFDPGALETTITLRPPAAPPSPALDGTVTLARSATPVESNQALALELGETSVAGGNVVGGAVADLFSALPQAGLSDLDGAGGRDVTLSGGELVAGAYGTLFMTLTLSDDGAPPSSVHVTATLNVMAFNDPPSYATLTGEPAGASTPVTVMVRPPAIAPSPAFDEPQLVARAATTVESHQALALELGETSVAGGNVGGGAAADLFSALPQAGLSDLDGAGLRNVTLAGGELVAGAYGRLFMTLTLSDDGVPPGSITVVATVVVEPVNDAPTFELPDDDAITLALLPDAVELSRSVRPDPVMASRTVAAQTVTLRVDEDALASDEVVTLVLASDSDPVEEGQNVSLLGAGEVRGGNIEGRGTAALFASAPLLVFANDTASCDPAGSCAVRLVVPPPRPDAYGDWVFTASLTDNGVPTAHATLAVVSLQVAQVNDPPQFELVSELPPTPPSLTLEVIEAAPPAERTLRVVLDEDFAGEFPLVTVARAATAVEAGEVLEGALAGARLVGGNVDGRPLDALFATAPALALDHLLADGSRSAVFSGGVLAADAYGTLLATLVLTDSGPRPSTVTELVMVVRPVNDPPEFVPFTGVQPNPDATVSLSPDGLALATVTLDEDDRPVIETPVRLATGATQVEEGQELRALFDNARVEGGVVAGMPTTALFSVAPTLRIDEVDGVVMFAGGTLAENANGSWIADVYLAESTPGEPTVSVLLGRATITVRPQDDPPEFGALAPGAVDGTVLVSVFSNVDAIPPTLVATGAHDPDGDAVVGVILSAASTPAENELFDVAPTATVNADGELLVAGANPNGMSGVWQGMVGIVSGGETVTVGFVRFELVSELLVMVTIAGERAATVSPTEYFGEARGRQNEPLSITLQIDFGLLPDGVEGSLRYLNAPRGNTVVRSDDERPRLFAEGVVPVSDDAEDILIFTDLSGPIRATLEVTPAEDAIGSIDLPVTLTVGSLRATLTARAIFEIPPLARPEVVVADDFVRTQVPGGGVAYFRANDEGLTIVLLEGAEFAGHLLASGVFETTSLTATLAGLSVRAAPLTLADNPFAELADENPFEDFGGDTVTLTSNVGTPDEFFDEVSLDALVCTETRTLANCFAGDFALGAARLSPDAHGVLEAIATSTRRAGVVFGDPDNSSRTAVLIPTVRVLVLPQPEELALTPLAASTSVVVNENAAATEFVWASVVDPEGGFIAASRLALAVEGEAALAVGEGEHATVTANVRTPRELFPTAPTPVLLQQPDGADARLVLNIPAPAANAHGVWAATLRARHRDGELELPMRIVVRPVATPPLLAVTPADGRIDNWRVSAGTPVGAPARNVRLAPVAAASTMTAVVTLDFLGDAEAVTLRAVEEGPARDAVFASLELAETAAAAVRSTELAVLPTAPLLGAAPRTAALVISPKPGLSAARLPVTVVVRIEASRDERMLTAGLYTVVLTSDNAPPALGTADADQNIGIDSDTAALQILDGVQDPDAGRGQMVTLFLQNRAVSGGVPSENALFLEPPQVAPNAGVAGELGAVRLTNMRPRPGAHGVWTAELVVADDGWPREHVSLSLTVTVLALFDPPTLTLASLSLAIAEDAPRGPALTLATGVRATDPEGINLRARFAAGRESGVAAAALFRDAPSVFLTPAGALVVAAGAPRLDVTGRWRDNVTVRYDVYADHPFDPAPDCLQNCVLTVLSATIDIEERTDGRGEADISIVLPEARVPPTLTVAAPAADVMLGMTRVASGVRCVTEGVREVLCSLRAYYAEGACDPLPFEHEIAAQCQPVETARADDGGVDVILPPGISELWWFAEFESSPVSLLSSTGDRKQSYYVPPALGFGPDRIAYRRAGDEGIVTTWVSLYVQNPAPPPAGVARISVAVADIVGVPDGVNVAPARLVFAPPHRLPMTLFVAAPFDADGSYTLRLQDAAFAVGAGGYARGKADWVLSVRTGDPGALAAPRVAVRALAARDPLGNRAESGAFASSDGRFVDRALLIELPGRDLVFSFAPGHPQDLNAQMTVYVSALHNGSELADSPSVVLSSRNGATVTLREFAVARDDSLTVDDFLTVRTRVGSPDDYDSLIESLVPVLAAAAAPPDDADRDGVPGDDGRQFLRAGGIAGGWRANPPEWLAVPPGHRIALGRTAMREGAEGARIALGSSPPGYSNGGISDFVVHLAPGARSARVVVPQMTPLPEGAVYYKYRPHGVGWSPFVQRGLGDALYSAPAPCPSVEDLRGDDIPAPWRPGLNAGHRCVLLVISDGGPNDGDAGEQPTDGARANRVVVDPGAVGGPPGSRPRPTPPSQPAASSGGGGGGGGAVGLEFVLLLAGAFYAACCAALRRAKRARRRAFSFHLRSAQSRRAGTDCGCWRPRGDAV